MLIVVGFKSIISIELIHYVLQHCAICILVTQHTTVYILREREREIEKERERETERERMRKRERHAVSQQCLIIWYFTDLFFDTYK